VEPTPIVALQDHRVCQVVAGNAHCAALTEDGALFTWATGDDDGTDNAETDQPIPQLDYGNIVHDFGAPYRVFALVGVRISSVAVGDEFTVAATEAGAAYSFGAGDGRLGHGAGSAEDVFVPKRIEALDGIHVDTVAAGAYHALALTRCGPDGCWCALHLGGRLQLPWP
jgi:alpha-tubulin suppressor-like RCC1 family protein